MPRKVSQPILAGASDLAPPCAGWLLPDDAPQAASSVAPGTAAALAARAASARRRVIVTDCDCVLDMFLFLPAAGVLSASEADRAGRGWRHYRPARQPVPTAWSDLRQLPVSRWCANGWRRAGVYPLPRDPGLLRQLLSASARPDPRLRGPEGGVRLRPPRRADHGPVRAGRRFAGGDRRRGELRLRHGRDPRRAAGRGGRTGRRGGRRA